MTGRISILLLTALSSCGTGAVMKCKTSCGMELYSTHPGGELPSPWECEDIDRGEHDALQAFRDYVTNPVTTTAMCERLKGVRVFVHGVPYWKQLITDIEIAGQAVCWAHQIEIGTAPHIKGTALAHEMLHILENCKLDVNCDKDRTLDHCYWDSQGYQQAINAWAASPR